MPFIIPAAAAVATIYAAKKGADASKNAAATQGASADKALALQRQMYEQQQANLSPYRSLGAGSLQNLGNFQSFAGVPGAFGAGVNSQYQRPLSPGFQMPPQDASAGQSALPAGIPSRPRGAQPSIGTAVPRGTLANPGEAPPAGQIDMVTMQAPTGETMAVPASEVPHYMGKGARVMSEVAGYGR